jgi:RHH-type transcriptional regulator, rel operon repressor / antitoxin RelB
MTTSIRLDRTLEQRLHRLAERTGRTKAYFLREMIEGGLEDLEDYYLASATMENVHKDKENVYSALDVREGLGMIKKKSPKASIRGRQ